VALGIAAILAAFAADVASHRLQASSLPVTSAASFVAAFVAYEGVLFFTAITALGDLGAFTPEIVGRILAINAAAFLGLLLISRLGSMIGLAGLSDTRFATHRHA
jgi:hypothetical protein